MRDTCAMKCGLNQAPLSRVYGIFAGKEAVAHDGATSLHDRPADLLGGVDEEKLLDEVGMVYEKGIFPTQAELHDIPVGRGEPLQIRERASAERDGLADAESRARSGCALR